MFIELHVIVSEDAIERCNYFCTKFIAQNVDFFVVYCNVVLKVVQMVKEVMVVSNQCIGWEEIKFLDNIFILLVSGKNFLLKFSEVFLVGFRTDFIKNFLEIIGDILKFHFAGLSLLL